MVDPDLLNAIKGKFPSAAEEQISASVILSAQDIAAAALFLKNFHNFDYLMNLAAIDYKDRLAVVYNIYSFKTGKKIALKVYVAKDSASVPSITWVFPAANWHEREAYDLIGITFTSHPDLRRILLSDNWVGHPLRKDYVKDGLVPMPRI